MQKLQSQAVHHITIVGADRQTSIDGRFITSSPTKGASRIPLEPLQTPAAYTSSRSPCRRPPSRRRSSAPTSAASIAEGPYS
jgi:hypothetical protein